MNNCFSENAWSETRIKNKQVDQSFASGYVGLLNV